MARPKKVANAQVTPAGEKKPASPSLPGLGVPRKVDFTPEQRAHLRQILNDPIFLLAWYNAEVSRPSAFIAGLDGQFGLQIGNNALHCEKGWDLHKAALLRETEEMRPAAPSMAETYPDEGTLEADMAARIAKTKTKQT